MTKHSKKRFHFNNDFTFHFQIYRSNYIIFIVLIHLYDFNYIKNILMLMNNNCEV
jgi:hypothetical protein